MAYMAGAAALLGGDSILRRSATDSGQRSLCEVREYCEASTVIYYMLSQTWRGVRRMSMATFAW